MTSAAARAPRTALAGLLLLSASTLLLEVALTRVLSVALWYHFAFMVVSTALFGFGFAGVALSLRRQAQTIPPRLAAASALATPLAVLFGYWLFNQVPFEPFSLGLSAVQWLYLPIAYLALALPFFLSGLTVAALLTRCARAVDRLYLFDLVGAGLGSLLVAAFLPAFGGSGTIAAAAALAALGAALIAWEADRRLGAVGALGAAAIAALVPFADRALPLRISRDKVAAKGVPIARVLEDRKVVLHTAWNTMSRIDVVEPPARGERRLVLIDAGTAVTRLAHPEAPVSSLGRTEDEESFFAQLYERPSALIVGSGGGREVLLALRNGARRVVAVEINPAIQRVVSEVMADYTGHLYQDPRVEAVTDEARSYLRRSRETFELIECPHTISNAALSSGSLSLAENHLLTLEAFDDYLAHLAPDGVLVITRPEAQLPRLFTTARAAAARLGLDPSRRVLAWRRSEPEVGSAAKRHPGAAATEGRKPRLSFHSGFALKRTEFSEDEVRRFAVALQRAGLEPLYLPGQVAQEPYASLLTAAEPTRVKIPFAAILEPATDDSPFFNRRVPISELRLSDLAGVFGRGRDSREALEDRPVAEAALVALLAESALLALLFIVLPLAVFRRRSLGGEGRLRSMAAFGALGLAYIVVEVGLLQRFTLFLGKPVVLFSTVLGALLVSSGLGSAASRRMAGRPGAAWKACAGSALAALAIGLGAAPLAASRLLALPEAGRILAAALLIAPAGFAMGLPFPLLVRRLEASHPERIPWAWGLNGFASVVGSVGAIVLGMAAGYTAVFAAGALCYVLAAASARESA